LIASGLVVEMKIVRTVCRPALAGSSPVRTDGSVGSGVAAVERGPATGLILLLMGSQEIDGPPRLVSRGDVHPEYPVGYSCFNDDGEF
jgi:hypothetical protein